MSIGDGVANAIENVLENYHQKPGGDGERAMLFECLIKNAGELVKLFLNYLAMSSLLGGLTWDLATTNNGHHLQAIAVSYKTSA